MEEIIKISEGIGPNYASAYDDFVKEMRKVGFEVVENQYNDELEPEKVILAVTENYPLAGLSLDLIAQNKRLKELRERNPDHTIINIALRDAYDAYAIEGIDSFVTALGSNISNVKSMVNLLAGRVKANGQLPITPIDY